MKVELSLTELDILTVLIASQADSFTKDPEEIMTLQEAGAKLSLAYIEGLKAEIKKR